MITVKDIIAAREKLEHECIKPEADGHYRFCITREDAPGLFASLDSLALYPGGSGPPKCLLPGETWLGSIAGVHIIAKDDQ